MNGKDHWELPTLLFFVNASRNSTDGRRVREFRTRVRCASNSEVMYRDDYGRREAIIALLTAARRLRPKLIYVELFAYSGLVGAIAAKLFWGCRIAVGNGDDVVDTHLKARRFGRAAVAWILERFLWRFADCWAVWSPYYRRWLQQRGVRNVVCVPGAVDLAVMRPTDGAALRTQLGFNGVLVVGVVGNLQYSRHLDMVYGWDLIGALAQLREVPVCGLIVGDGTGLPWLKSEATRLGVSDRVRFVGSIPHAELPAYYGAMDVGLVTLSNDRDARFTWTAKLPEYMACNVFPVMTDVEPSRRFVARCGALLPFTGAKDMAYPQRLASLLRTLHETPSLIERRQCARAIAEAYMSFPVAARHLQRGFARAMQ
jgi:glycogen(starch) synthase